MKVNVENICGERFDFRGYKKLIEEIALVLENDKKLPEKMEVNVMICDEDCIKKINKDTRGINKVTDVLSFPYFEFDEPGNVNRKNLIEGENILGDVVICAQKIKSQAQQFGHSQKRELAYLTLHSMLHLIGYDHIDENDEKVMNSEADRIMEKLNIVR